MDRQIVSTLYYSFALWSYQSSFQKVHGSELELKSWKENSQKASPEKMWWGIPLKECGTHFSVLFEEWGKSFPEFWMLQAVNASPWSNVPTPCLERQMPSEMSGAHCGKEIFPARQAHSFSNWLTDFRRILWIFWEGRRHTSVPKQLDPHTLLKHGPETRATPLTFNTYPTYNTRTYAPLRFPLQRLWHDVWAPASFRRGTRAVPQVRRHGCHKTPLPSFSDF